MANKNPAPSAKGLFTAIKTKKRAPVGTIDPVLFPEVKKPNYKKAAERRDDDFYPTGEPEAIRALLAADGDRLRDLGHVWEPACGDGAMVREIRAAGLRCTASDLINRGCPDSTVANYFKLHRSKAPAKITNPPYNLINARDGHGKWLRHSLAMPDWRYMALLLSWDWAAARSNGLGELLDANPFSYCYLMRWKLDFTGEGSPPQRNAWFVWDRDDPRSNAGHGPHPEPGFRFMDRVDYRQATMF